MPESIPTFPAEPTGGSLRGAYYVATNTTFGTGIVACSATRTTYSATEVMLLCDFPASATGAVMIPDFIRLICTAAGTAYTSFQMAVVLATNERFQEFGVELTADANASLRETASPVARWWMHNNDLAVNAATGARQLARFAAKNAILAVHDEIVLAFGDKAHGGSRVFNLPPAVLKPGSSMALHCWGPAMTAAPSFEVSLGWLEKA